MDFQVSEEIKKTLEAMKISKDLDINIDKVKKREIKDKYKFIKLLGSGLFSKVFLVEDDSGAKFAMKVISKQDFTTREHIQKILIEKEIMKKLNHRNILKLYKTFQTQNKFYLVIEYAENGKTQTQLF